MYDGGIIILIEDNYEDALEFRVTYSDMGYSNPLYIFIKPEPLFTLVHDQAHQPSLVISKMYLPGWNAVELRAALDLEAAAQRDDIRYVVFANNVTARERNIALANGITGVFNKPGNLVEMRAAIDEMMCVGLRSC